MTVYFYALFVHLSLNVYIFLKGMRLLEGRKVWRTIFASFFILEFALYLTGLYFQSILPDEIVRFLWLMGSTWMVFIFYMTLLWLVIDLVLYLNRRRPFLGEYLNIHPKRTGATFFIITTLSIATIMYMGNYRFRNPVVTELDMTVNKEAGDRSSLRIAVISDVHLGYLIHKPYAKRYVDLIIAQNPDIVLFVGDIIDAEIAPIIEQNMKEDFLRLNPPLGVYSCTGNHEYRYEADYKINWLNDQANIKMIRDSAVLIDSSFYVVGREDWIIPTRKKLETILEEQHVDQSLPVIVLNHSPYTLDDEVEAGVDLALYGHTHDGQVFPFNLYTRLIFEVAHGYKKKQNTHIYVSSGLGLSGPQYRIGTISEIAILNVTFSGNVENL